MNPSKATFSANNAPSVPDMEMGDDHTKDTIDSAAALVATPKQNISKPDDEVVMKIEEDGEVNVDSVGSENVTEDVKRTEDVVAQNVKELLQGGGKVMLEIADGKANIFVVGRDGDPVKAVITNSADGIKPNQVALTLCAQLGAVFVGNALNKQSSSSFSCSCSALAAPSPSHSPSNSEFPEWIIATVTVSNLIGFVSTLIAMSLENQKSRPSSRKRTVSSVVGKFGLAAVASTFIVSTGAALPLGINGNLAVTAVASLPSLFAVALA